MFFQKPEVGDDKYLSEGGPAPAGLGSGRLEETSKALSSVPSGNSGRARGQTGVLVG